MKLLKNSPEWCTIRKGCSRVEISKQAKKDLIQIPRYIAAKLRAWIDDVKKVGVENVRLTTSYHDEPLKGKLRKKRSIRLSKSYRAIYCMKQDNSIDLIMIEEINKHEYKK